MLCGVWIFDRFVRAGTSYIYIYREREREGQTDRQYSLFDRYSVTYTIFINNGNCPVNWTMPASYHSQRKSEIANLKMSKNKGRNIMGKWIPFGRHTFLSMLMLCWFCGGRFETNKLSNLHISRMIYSRSTCLSTYITKHKKHKFTVYKCISNKMSKRLLIVPVSDEGHSKGPTSVNE